MKHFNHKIFSIAILAAMAASCTDEYNCDLKVDEKPTEVANSQYLSQFASLKQYAEESGVKMGVNMAPDLLKQKNVAYSTLLSNFTSVDVNGAFSPLNNLKDDGSYDFDGMSPILDLTTEAGLDLYGGALVSKQGQRTAYYNKLIEPIEIPVKPEKGTDLVLDFENDEIGTKYMIATDDGIVDGVYAEVVEDPKNPGNKCLHYTSPSWNFRRPHFVFTLPGGRVLSNYYSVTYDVLAANVDGFDSVIMFGNNKSAKKDCGSYKALGAKNGEWSTLVDLNVSAQLAALSAAQLSSSQVVMSLGPIQPDADCYFDNIKMSYEVSGKGITSINFEDKPVGYSYEMTGLNPWGGGFQNPNGKNEVVEDETHGKVLRVEMNQTHPKFHIVLKDGMTLADYTHVTMDMRLRNGMYGAGMRFIINDKVFSLKSAANYGFKQDDQWKDEGILVKFAREGEGTDDGTVYLPESLLSLTEFDFSLGSASGSWWGDIDNINFYWVAKPKIVEKTEEEKTEIFTREMEKWVGGMAYSGYNAAVPEKSVKAWNVISEPLSDISDENTFDWGQYLGETGYAQMAVKMVRDTLKNTDTKPELYVSQTFIAFDEMGSKADQLVSLVKDWEADGVTKLDGFNIILNLVYSQDGLTQNGLKQKVTDLFTALAKSNKKVRVSNLSVEVEDPDGSNIAPSKLTVSEREDIATYIAFVIKEYRRLIPADSQAGISIASMAESANQTTVCPWTSGYNRNSIYEGFVNGLK